MGKLKKLLSEDEYIGKLKKFQDTLIFGFPISQLDEEELKVAFVMVIENYDQTISNMSSSIELLQYLNKG